LLVEEHPVQASFENIFGINHFELLRFIQTSQAMLVHSPQRRPLCNPYISADLPHPFWIGMGASFRGGGHQEKNLTRMDLEERNVA
jgi:hypothetical protein